MPKNGLNVALKGVDEIFSTEESRHAEQREQVQQIPIAELFPFKNHPFRVQDDEETENAVKSISQYGVLTPLIARPRPEGGYEIISGHRRQHAAQLAGLETVPVIVRDMSDDAATILMVDSNLQRENILPSERAFAYKMKMEAMLKKIVLFQISLFVAFLALMARWLLTLSSYVVAPLMLYIFGCGIYTAYRQTWNQFFILLVAEFICFILFFGATAITEGIGRFSEWLAEL